MPDVASACSYVRRAWPVVAGPVRLMAIRMASSTARSPALIVRQRVLTAGSPVTWDRVQAGWQWLLADDVPGLLAWSRGPESTGIGVVTG